MVVARITFIRYKAPPMEHYVALRDYLLDSSGGKYDSLAYRNQRDNVKSGQLSRTALAGKMDLLLAFSEAAAVLVHSLVLSNRTKSMD